MGRDGGQQRRPSVLRTEGTGEFMKRLFLGVVILGGAGLLGGCPIYPDNNSYDDDLCTECCVYGNCSYGYTCSSYGGGSYSCSSSGYPTPAYDASAAGCST